MESPRPVKTAELAVRIGKSESQTRRILAKLERLQLVERVSERGGWILSCPPILDLYAAAGLPRPPRRDIAAEGDSLADGASRER